MHPVDKTYFDVTRKDIRPAQSKKKKTKTRSFFSQDGLYEKEKKVYRYIWGPSVVSSAASGKKGVLIR